MNNSLSSHLRLLAIVLVPFTSGCVCWDACNAPGGQGGHFAEGYIDGFDGHGHVVGWTGPSMCYGYYPTCWRPWPLECPPCPPFALEPVGAEVVKPPFGAVAPAAPDLPAAPPVESTPDSILVPSGEPTPTPVPMIDLPGPPMPSVAPPQPLPEQESSSRRRWTKAEFISRPGEGPDEILFR